MFEDLSEVDGREVDPAASDRGVVHCIWRALQRDRPLARADGWAELADRYPHDGRFRLLALTASLTLPVAEEDREAVIVELRDGASLARSVDRILADGSGLREAVVDLLSILREPVTRASADPSGRARREAFEALAERFDGARRAPNEAAGRLSRLETLVLEECHDRTLGDRPLARRKPPTAAGPDDYETLLRGASARPEKEWSAKVTLHPGDRVRHAAFGLGVVVATREKKADILFPQGKKTLACR